MVGESGSVGLQDDEKEEDDSLDETEAGVYARLERMRQRARGKRPVGVRHSALDDEDEDEAGFDTWLDEDQLFTANVQVRVQEFILVAQLLIRFVRIQTILDEHDDILRAHTLRPKHKEKDDLTSFQQASEYLHDELFVCCESGLTGSFFRAQKRSRHS